MEARGGAAIILAAGVGRRLQSRDLPKSLLSFSGRSLLERHVRALRAIGVEDIHVVGGHRIDAISDELTRIGGPVHLHKNEHYTRGSMLSLMVMASLLRAGKPIVLMDADVLFDPDMLERLVDSRHPNSLLVDMHPVDEEAVKLCFRDGAIVDFHKRPEHAYDTCGESIGFFRFSPAMASALADRCDRHVGDGRLDLEYEAPLRELLIEQPDAFGAEDVTGMPWIEIDFDADVERAHREILPRLEALV